MKSKSLLLPYNTKKWEYDTPPVVPDVDTLKTIVCQKIPTAGRRCNFFDKKLVKEIVQLLCFNIYVEFSIY